MASAGSIDPVRPSAALRFGYQKRMDAIIVRMAADTERQIRRTFKAKAPELTVYAQDASPARTLRAIVEGLSRKWGREIDALAPKMADWFATMAKDRCQRQLRDNMREAGITVSFKATAAMNDAYQAVVGENIGLIKSIPERYFAQVQTLTMQSVQSGRDIGHLAKGLQDQLGVTKRRAALIARDQNNKATATLTRTRYLGMGITEARWLHSAGGRTPRPPHVDFSGQKYSLVEGHDFGDGNGFVHPGELINCRCVPRPVVAGFD